MPNTKDLNMVKEMEHEKEEILKKIKYNQDNILLSKEEKKLLTKEGRNKFIFSLGLIAEQYLEHPELLSNEDINRIFALAFGESAVKELMSKLAKDNKEEYLRKCTE